LAGHDGNFELSAATLAHGREHADITTLVEHAAPSAKSRQVVKSVIAGHGRGIYQGKIVVREGANGTDSHQLSKSILLSPTAEADTKPELEIYADDVKCGHGATAGALDENALFYLRSRGIPEQSATAMLLEAFIEDAVAAISDEAIRAVISHAARSKLERLGGEA
jgi:Fe-S cluster assembly protein SufD